jgi:hypothetical protein
VALRAEGLAPRRRAHRAVAGELVEGLAEPVTQARSGKQGAPALGRAGEASAQPPPAPLGRLLLERRALELLGGRGKGCGPGLRGRAQRPAPAALDKRGHLDLVRQTAAVLLVGQEGGGHGQSTPGQDRDEAGGAAGTDEAIERQRREVLEDRTPLPAQAALRGQ